MISTKPWGIEAVARLCLAMIATFCFGGLLAISVGKLHLGLPEGQTEFIQIMISLASFQFSALVWVTIFVRKFGLGWTEAFGFKTSEPVTAVAYGVLGGVLFLPAAWGLQYLSEFLMVLAHLNPESQAAVQAMQDPNLSIMNKLIFGAAAVVFAPIAEETVFRGLLYPAIKQAGFPRLALWGTSVGFAAMHLNAETFLPLMAFAMVLVYLYEQFGNLLAPIVAHSLFNTVNFLFLLFPEKVEHFFHPL
ncbi:MAG TPA: type II CAAX endopeptidase family protein [Verrucomicrobiae bacterium]|jgi:membrane protease YdiL (CAAX protease family)